VSVLTIRQTVNYAIIFLQQQMGHMVTFLEMSGFRITSCISRTVSGINLV